VVRLARRSPRIMSTKKIPAVAVADARLMLLNGLALLDDPSRPATLRSTEKVIRKLGFVQVDSIQRIERAHHLILGTRLDNYKPELLDRLAFEHRILFEHWTHDASYIPTDLFHHWHHRFARTDVRLRKSRWFTHRLGKDPEATVAKVLERVSKHGAVRAQDFERAEDTRTTGWWDWTPEKAALEFLWHTGKLAISGRDRFQKLYDLTERVFPEIHPLPPSTADGHVDWACRSALERLGFATPSELAGFWDAVSIAEAKAWTEARAATGEICAVQVKDVKAKKPRLAYAFTDWRKRLSACGDAPDEIRLLAPFDPLIRDRDRALRLFDFDYRFEAFVPERKRKYGYYVLAILERDALVGRLDAYTERDRNRLFVRRVWWEPKVKPTRKRLAALDLAFAKLAARIGVENVTIKKAGMTTKTQKRRTEK
jgi:uncharacterized protein YcaQ